MFLNLKRDISCQTLLYLLNSEKGKDLAFEGIHKLEMSEIENQLNHINKAAQNTYNLLEVLQKKKEQAWDYYFVKNL